MKADEAEFLKACQERDPDEETIRDVIAKVGINHKRAWYLLDKWSNRDWYNWGVCIDLGWMTDDGLKANTSTDTR